MSEKKPSQQSAKPNCLEVANAAVNGDRGESYGHPYEDFSRTAQMWSAILGTPVSPEQVPLCMIAVKISRECHKPKADNAVDIAGYALTLEMVNDYKAEHAK